MRKMLDFDQRGLVRRFQRGGQIVEIRDIVDIGERLLKRNEVTAKAWKEFRHRFARGKRAFAQRPGRDEKRLAQIGARKPGAGIVRRQQRRRASGRGQIIALQCKKRRQVGDGVFAGIPALADDPTQVSVAAAELEYPRKRGKLDPMAVQKL
ncbi:MAG TPA: hypothetical protein VG475_00285, partial [Pseudolabrys sp.]|nr:hypothetical protein [Pseudolabrys sp.]